MTHPARSEAPTQTSTPSVHQSVHHSTISSPVPSIPSNPKEEWITSLSLASQIRAVFVDAIDDDVSGIYETLDLTFKWNERRRSKLEESNNELNRLHRQIETKKEGLEKLKSSCNAREIQAELYTIEQDSYEEAKKFKDLDNQTSMIKAQISQNQNHIKQIEKYDPIQQFSSDEDKQQQATSAEMFKVKLYHELGFVMLQTASTALPQTVSQPAKLFIRSCNPSRSRLITEPQTSRERFETANRIWHLIE